jgi:transposase
MSRFKAYHQNQIMLMPPSLDEKVSRDHLARYISRVVDQLDTSGIEAGYSDIGCPGYHPKMLVKVLVYGYSIGIRSSRRLQKELQEDVVFMWLSGMQEPDFRTISDFRKGRLKDVKKLFKQILDVCVELGMVRCGKISIDGTKIEANSSRNRIIYRKSLEKSLKGYEEKIDQIMKEAEEVDAEEDRLYGDTDGYSIEPHTAEEIRKALKKLNQKKGRLEREKGKLQTKVEVVDLKLQIMGDKRNSYGTTDPDATLMLMKRDSLGVGYNVQMATENQVIVGYGVFQRRTDNRLLPTMVNEVENNLSSKPQVVMADKGYCSQGNYEYLDHSGIRGAIPPNTYDYDMAARRKGIYRPSTNHEYERLKLDMLDFLQTAEGKGLMDYRKHDIEPTFGDIKHNMGFRKLLLRGLPKVKTEIGLVAIAHNLKKIKRWLTNPELVTEDAF